MALFTPILMSANGFSAPLLIPMKQEIYEGLGLALLVNFSGGGPASATATVQVCCDPALASNPAAARWNNHDVLNALTADKNSSVVFPVYGIRLAITNYVSGSVQLQIGSQDYML